MRILIIGDVVGVPGRDYLQSVLFRLRSQLKADFCIVNGENSAATNGISVNSAKLLYDSGADVITTGNHAFRRAKELEEVFDGNIPVIRPANYPNRLPGKGSVVVRTDTEDVAVINVIGRIFMSPVDCPFEAVDRELERVKDCKIKIVDFHAEATSEKLAMLHHLDGRVSAVAGTHTHVQTADERVTEKGTAYISDLGMTGVTDSILGVKKEIIYNRYMNYASDRFENAEGKCRLSGIIAEIDASTGKALSIERVNV